MPDAISCIAVGGYLDPVILEASTIIGISALADIVTRGSDILVDFIELAIRHGRPLFDAILESRVVRLRPILLTAGAALLSSIPMTTCPSSLTSVAQERQMIGTGGVVRSWIVSPAHSAAVLSPDGRKE